MQRMKNSMFELTFNLSVIRRILLIFLFSIFTFVIFFSGKNRSFSHTYYYTVCQSENFHRSINQLYFKQLIITDSNFKWISYIDKNVVLEKDEYSLSKSDDCVFINFSFDGIDTTIKYLSFTDTLPYLNINGLNSGVPYPNGAIYYAGEEEITINNITKKAFKFEILSGKFFTDLTMFEYKSIIYFERTSLVPIKLEDFKYNLVTKKLDNRFSRNMIINSLDW